MKSWGYMQGSDRQADGASHRAEYMHHRWKFALQVSGGLGLTCSEDCSYDITSEIATQLTSLL
jgi:hypothetical protein